MIAKSRCQRAFFNISGANLAKSMEKRRSALKTLGLIRVALIAGIGFLMMNPLSARAQDAVTATAAAAASPGPGGTEATAERVIVTGSNIPTAEEVGPNPVDTYRRDDITRLGVRTPTDLIQRIPAVTGSTSTRTTPMAVTDVLASTCAASIRRKRLF